MVLATSLARRCRRDDLEVHRHFHLQSILALVVVFTMNNFSICLLWEVESVAQSWKSLEDGECQEHRLKLPEIPYVEAVSWKFLNIETSYIGWYIREAGAASLTIGLCIHNLFAVLVEWYQVCSLPLPPLLPLFQPVLVIGTHCSYTMT